MQVAVPTSALIHSEEVMTPSFAENEAVPLDHLDFSRPLSELLRIGTERAHSDVENSLGAVRLVQGELPREAYVRFLMMLWHVYEVLERALDEHASYPALASTYRPALLARAPRLSDDLAYFLETPDWKSHRDYTSFAQSLPLELVEYTARISEIQRSFDPFPLLAHAYVRYLGDLSGGQFIRRRIMKAYDLPEGGSGTAFYEFHTLDGGAKANMGDMKRIKEWYRKGMDDAVQDEGRKVALVAAANEAFRFNAGLFSTLHPIKTVQQLAWTPLNQETEDDAAGSPEKASEFPIASVMAVILALALAHFALVVFGYTGQSGYDKMVAAQQWVHQLLSGWD